MGGGCPCENVLLVGFIFIKISKALILSDSFRQVTSNIINIDQFYNNILNRLKEEYVKSAGDRLSSLLSKSKFTNHKISSLSITLLQTPWI